MFRITLALVLTAAVAATAASGQVPAPDFILDVPLITPNLLVASFTVHGPPGSPVQVLLTFDDPFATPPAQIVIHPFLAGQTDAAGSFAVPAQVVNWQGPLPDVWFGAVVGMPPVLAGISGFSGALACAACGPPFDTHSAAFAFDRTNEHLTVKVSGNEGPYTIWEVPCPAPPEGAAWTPGASATFLESTTTTPAGCEGWDDAYAVPASGQSKCLVVRSNGVAGVIVERYRING